MITVAINGFGRIGRNFLRTVLLDEQARKQISVVAINVGPADLKTSAYLFQYDSVMGKFGQAVELRGDYLIIGGTKIRLIASCDVRAIDWKVYGIDWIVEASGRFTDRASAQLHLDSGAARVLITAPAHDEDITIIPGVNDTAYEKTKHRIVALGSCTTNAFIPLLKVLHERFGIEEGFMTTVHAYTNTQVLLDVQGEDERRSRAAALNIIPTSTGVSRLIEQLIPDLKGCIKAVALRVPVPKVSLIDFSFLSRTELSTEAINDLFVQKAKTDSLSGIIGTTDRPLVSTDFYGDSHSVVVDTQLTSACRKMGKVFGWYDNEWGFSERLKGFLTKAA